MVLQKGNTDLFVVFIIVTAYTSVELYVLENKAHGKQAYMSSTGGDKVAERAVDGDVSQDAADNSCFLTKTETNAYWEVDLGDKMFIDHVTLYSRKNVDDLLSARRLRDIELYIGPSRNAYTLYGFYEGTLPKGIIHTFNLTNTVFGQWVRITRSESVVERFELCEVEVYGYPPAYYYRLDKGRAGVHALNTAPSQSLSIHQCAFICYKTNGCYGATFNEVTHMCEYLTSDTGVETNNSSMLIQLG
ncbi:uncharacterized protein LOC132729539 isoform X1 [Ruditapes philippinarum]|uniref:uncharacterized protein LOC132729539 isoform X1 n=1 Tax=Ruditapes philippinarum TaxID=129788 RepID=UPI00295B1906|nr:uncharacterized protein LOC132729539 isoform X1 [Ruditapes philippinarum]